ncbi:MAG: hypothetical protein ACRD0A_16785 [Acidimicrobiales bacterium]
MTTDIDRWAERTARLDLSDIDFDAFTDQPLGPDVLRSLRYMHDVEYHAAVRGRRRWRDKVDPIAHLLGSAMAGPSFIAIHMSWGAVNEWTTQAGYARLIAKARHPVLTTLLKRIMRQEGRHIDFYSSTARELLTGNRRAQRLARFALERLWKPVGAGVMPDEEVRFLIGFLFGDQDGREWAARVDNSVDRLPGLSGLHLAAGAVDSYADPVRRAA